MTHIKEEYKSTGEQSPQRSEEAEQWRKEETEEDTDGRKVDAGDYDTAEDEEMGELSSTLLSDVTNLQPSTSFQMISPIKSPPKKPKQKTMKRKRSDYLFDSFTPIAVRKHKRH